MKKLIQNLQQNNIQYKENVMLSTVTTFKIGGPAKLVIEPRGTEQVATAVKICREADCPYFVIGRGSNILASDEGTDVVIIKIYQDSGDITLEEDGIHCGSGVSLKALAGFACEHEIGGYEPLSGIPGLVGGAIRMNAGAYGGQIADVFKSCTYVDSEGKVGIIDKEQADFDYRHSFFADKADYIITEAVFSRENHRKKEEIENDIADYAERRKTKQPLDLPSAGSTFKRPVGGYASALIDEAGLKGRSVGGACVSPKHAGFVVNNGGATAKDVLELIETVKKEVKDRSGISLEPEIIYIGKNGKENI